MTKQTPQPSIEEQQKLLNLYNQGIVHESIKNTEDFVSNFPNHVFGWKILSGLMLSLGRINEALEAAIKAVNIQPDDKNAIHNLTTIYKELGLQYQKKYHLKEAEFNYLKCLELNPNCSETYNYLGILYENQNKLQLAETHYRLSIKEKIDYVAAYSNLGGLLNSQKKLLEAEKVFLEALNYSPENRYIIGMLFYIRAQTCNWKNLQANSDFLWNCFQKSTEKVLVPTIFLSNQNFNLYHHYKIGSEFAEINYCHQLPPPLTNENTYNHKKLRIGYLSADFHAHATVHLIIGVLENRNTELFDVYLYSYGVETKDNYRSRVENACEFFHNVKKLSDEDIAKKIRIDEIDILIDLKGYTQDGRLRIQALRPAPIIISWLGYPATLGHEKLADYVIGDATVTPTEHAKYFSETLALMPYCYQPNDNTRPIGRCPTRAEAGLPENAFVFATFNQSYKITPDMFDIWCRLLISIPNSVLWILEPIDVTQDNLSREITIRGIDSSRLIFAPKLQQTEHLGRLQLVDLAVDTFPYTSHTTASDALWAGVPLVTKKGETFASRVAASILQAMDLAELITTNDNDYFNVALKLAKNHKKLTAIKHKIATQKSTSPLFDTQKFARDLERIYQTIWEQELHGERKIVILKDELKMNTKQIPTQLADILQLERLTEVVDIGANPIDGEPPYKPMLSGGLCRVTGFEPQESALAKLLTKKRELERYLPYAIGDGKTHTLKICHASGMTSLFEPDAITLDLFAALKPCGVVTDRIEMQTQKLDDITEINQLDFLKIDIQGAELAVFQNGVQKLANTVAIQTEVSFVTLYENQPAMGEIDIELRQQGFIPHCFAAVKKWMIAPCIINNNPRQPLNQLLEADIVYVRDFSKPDLMTTEQLKHLAIIVHYCYGSFDLALRCILLLEQRNALPIGSQQQYLNLLTQKNE
jgi:protein O-GlcNAc transferase